MKMRTIFSLLIALFFVSTIDITTSFAQDFTQWSLPEGARARLGKGKIYDLTYSPDGTRFAVASGAGVWIYDAATREELTLLSISIPEEGRLAGDNRYSGGVAYSPDGSTIAMAGPDPTGVRIWDVGTGRLLKTFHTERYINTIAYSPDGNTIASGGRGGRVYLWDTATGTLKNTLISGSGDIAFSPDGATLAVGGRDHLRLWDVATGASLKTFNVEADVLSIAYSPDGSTIAVGGYQNTVFLLNAATGIPIDTLSGHGTYIGSIAYSPDGSTIAVGSSDSMVRLWDAATSRLRYTLRHIQYSDDVFVAFSPDGATLASGGGDGTVRLWDVATGDPRNTITGYTNLIRGGAFSPDGNILVIGGEYSLNIPSLWDVVTGRQIRTLELDSVNYYFGTGPVAYSPDGSTVAGKAYGGARLWDVATGTHLKTLEFANSPGIAYSPDGSTIANGGFSVAYSPDGTTLASAGSAVNLYDAATGTIKPALRDSDSSRANVRLWDVATGRVRDRLAMESGDYSHSVAYSPIGSTVAAGTRGGNVYLWNAATGRLMHRLTGHTNELWSVAYSPDGGTLASASWDGTVRLWDVATGTLKNTLRGHTNYVVSVAFSPDGGTLASGSFDGTVLLWQLTPTSGNPLTFNPSTVDDQTFEVGTPVNITLPSATGGTAPYTYTLSPIPAGLQFDATTQLLSGTPTTATPPTLTTYTATDATGRTADLTFTIMVTDAAPADITFIPNAIDDLTLTVNSPMEPMYLPLAEGGTSPYTYTLNPIPAGLSFDGGVQQLSGTPTTVGTTAATYTATDTSGASGSLTFSIEVVEDGTGPGGDPLDVDGDGQVTVIDLAVVALFYGTRVPVGVSLPADVNADGVVDLADLTAVAQGIDAVGGGLNQLPLWEVEAALFAAVEQVAEIEAVAGAPMGFGTHVLSGEITSRNVAAALVDVRQMRVGDVHLGKELAVLSEFLHLLAELTATPETTALLPNYPNPFNPETWIPYHLSKDAEVIVTIYDMRGVAVRELVLGHQAAGIYESRGRAVYWDGRNHHGEPVASGVYFYTLTAGDFTATRKMLIWK